MHALVTGVSAAGGLLLGDSSRSSSSGWASAGPRPSAGGAARRATRRTGVGASCPVVSGVAAARALLHVRRSGSSHPWRPPGARRRQRRRARRLRGAHRRRRRAGRLRRARAVAGGHQRRGLRAPASSPTASSTRPWPSGAVVRGASAVDDRWGSLARAAIAGAAAFAAFLVVHWPCPTAWASVTCACRRARLRHRMARAWATPSSGFLAAFVLGALVGVVAMAVSGAGRKTRIPFGPFLAAGAVLTVLWGSPCPRAVPSQRVTAPAR